jgi:hypothetical protein
MAGDRCRMASTTSQPLISGMIRSVTTRSYQPSAKRSRPLRPSGAVWQSYPNDANSEETISRMFGSSSMNSTRSRDAEPCTALLTSFRS